MCRPKSEGGRRCSAHTPTALARKNILRRIDRNSVNGNTDLVTRDAAILTGFDQGRAHYGEIVSPMAMELPDSIHHVFDMLRVDGYRPLVVGGSVRDALGGDSPKDIDVEVYGATIDQVSRSLRRQYRVDEVGKAFGVLKVTLPDGTDLDVSVPRRDNHTGAGHRGFSVETEVSMTAEEAASRRDYTINALGYDPEFNVCVDPYNGRDDLKNKHLRHVSEAFAEDPLRVLRGFQFASRFGMDMDPSTAQLSRNLAPRAGELATERVRGEFGKFYTKGKEPSRGLRVLKESGWDETIPGLAAANTEDMRAKMDNAHQVSKNHGLDSESRVRLMSGILARSMDDETARDFLDKTVEGADVQRSAWGLSRAQAPDQETDSAVRGWAHRLSSDKTSIRQWSHVEEATGDKDRAQRFARRAEELGCLDTPQQDLLMGRHLIERHPEKRPGPWMGQLLTRARKAQIDGEFTDFDGASQWLSRQGDL